MKKLLFILLILSSCTTSKVVQPVQKEPKTESKATWFDIIWPPGATVVIGGALFEIGSNQ